MITVKDKVVIVTVASQGLGRAFAETLAADGAKVVLASRNVEKLEKVVRDIEAKGGEAIFVATDVAKYDAVKRMVETTIKTYGRIDALVNNAAIVYEIKPQLFNAITEEDWDREFDVNVKGTWNCCRAVLPQLLKQKKGKIINISSSVAFRGGGMPTHYIATKGALISMTRALASEISVLSDGAMITVNTLAAGAVWNEASRKLSEFSPEGTEPVIQGILAGQTLKRLGMVEDLAGPLLFLVSDASNFMSGSVVCVDGGESRH
jgi:NAD(P)-dependent dehydrogenase (short-subunit alcohol dehydrogenase family)